MKAWLEIKYNNYDDCWDAIIEEIADVQICMEQVKLLLGISEKEVVSNMESKIIREKSRIRQNK